MGARIDPSRFPYREGKKGGPGDALRGFYGHPRSNTRGPNRVTCGIFLADPARDSPGRDIRASVSPSRPATRGVPSPLSLKAAAMGDPQVWIRDEALNNWDQPRHRGISCLSRPGINIGKTFTMGPSRHERRPNYSIARIWLVLTIPIFGVPFPTDTNWQRFFSVTVCNIN